jgi:hypothetical protein
MSGQNVGAQPVSDRDWVFGSRPRRLLLEGTLKGRVPAAGWSKTELAAIAGVSEHGGVDEHVAGLVAIGLLERRGRRLVLVSPRPGLAGALSSVVRELRHVPDERLREPVAAAGACRPATGSMSSPGGEVDGRVAARRELRRARSAVSRAVGISDATRRRAIDVLEEALSQIDRDS